MPIGNIQPPTVGIQDEPTICIEINTEWAAQLLGMIYPAQYPEWWSGTLEENRYARQQVRELLYIISLFKECGDMAQCCIQPYIIQRVNPDTHLVEISTNNGATWQPQPNSLPSVIVEPVPPVTAGTAGTKCDAATNFQTNVQAWITHVTNDFDTATSLLSFAAAVLEAILVAVVTILSLGTLTAIEAAVLPIIGAACAAVFAAGKTAFVDYWSSDIMHEILCAAYNNLSDDGSFTDAQFVSLWNDLNSNLTGNPAKNLLLGMLTSVGRQGVNNMAAQGGASGEDCSSCDEPICGQEWDIGNVDGNTAFGTRVSFSGDTYRFQSQLFSDGFHYLTIMLPTASPCCGVVSVTAHAGGSMPSTGTAANRIGCPNDQHVGNITSGDILSLPVNYIAWQSSNAFDIDIVFN